MKSKIFNMGKETVRLIRQSIYVLVLAVVLVISFSASSYAATLKTSAGDGKLEVPVDVYGEFSDAVFDPIGNIGEADTTYRSWVALRQGDSGQRTKLSSGSESKFTSEKPERAESSFSLNSLKFILAQTVERLYDYGNEQPTGSLLTQTYTITNPTTKTINFELIRYFDGDLNFDGSRSDGGGGNAKLLYETDAGDAGKASVSTTFVGITADGGKLPDTGRFDVDDYSKLSNDIINGNNLKNTITGDNNNDGFTDSAYDLALAFRNIFELTPGQSTTYTTTTRFGSGSVAVQPFAAPDNATTFVNIPVKISVLANDFSPKGSPILVSSQSSTDNGGRLEVNNNGTADNSTDDYLVYYPARDFVGSDQFRYTITNEAKATATGTVKVTVVLGNYVSDNQRLGQFTVPANLEAGVPFTNKTNQEISVTFSTEGTWSLGSGFPAVDANGFAQSYLGDYSKGLKYPDKAASSMLAVNKDNNPPIVNQVGKQRTITLAPGATLTFLNNDIVQPKSFYNDNADSITVKWSVSD